MTAVATTVAHGNLVCQQTATAKGSFAMLGSVQEWDTGVGLIAGQHHQVRIYTANHHPDTWADVS